jgi:hypothetical protein
MALRAVYIQQSKSLDKQTDAKRMELQAIEQYNAGLKGLITIIEKKLEIKKEDENK